MHLVRLGQGRWTVYAVCRADGRCPVLDFIASIDERRGKRILAKLQRYVPQSDVAEWIRVEFSKVLRGSNGINEFRWSARGGGAPRVLWFFDSGRIIVCTHGFEKKGSMRQEEVRVAEQIRFSYIAARDRGQLCVIALEDYLAESSA